jgi:uncharacterized secreted protein with C-terminal beta-propeller domain
MIKKTGPTFYWICLLIMLFLPVLFTGCSANGGTEIGNPIFQDFEMGTFSNNEDLRAYILDQYAKTVLPDYTYGPVMLPDISDDSLAEEPGTGESEDSAGGDDHSDTNLQEEGVDESDLVKNDGRYIYIARNDRVAIVDAENPAAMREKAAITVDGSVDSLYLYGDTLVILFVKDAGYRNNWNYPLEAEVMDIGYCYWIPVNSKIGVRIVTVTDPALPVTVAETVIEGNLISSRRIGGKLHLIQQFLPDLPPFEYAYDPHRESLSSVTASNQQKLEKTPLADLVPGYTTMDGNGKESEEIQLVSYDDFYKPGVTSGGSVVTITTIDLDDPAKPLESKGVVADAHTIYASPSALYLASTRWDETQYQEGAYSDVYRTYLYQFSFTESGVTATGTGEISGKILNQFSLGEYEDVLRVATTNGDTWLGDSVTNSVYCIKANEGRLNVIGEIKDIAKGETIYAARFMGKRGYLVTFVQTDPLFTLDLSDPTHPVIAGELKVPGYSTYLHPLSDDYLLTIGQDVSIFDGAVLPQGVQLCIFDIRDFSNPTLLFQETIGSRGTYSEALYNHKAFTYWASKNLLAIPVDLYEESSESPADTWGTYLYSGLYVYRIDPESAGFSHLGTLKRGQGANDYYSYGWSRGLFMGDYVFDVGPDGVRSAAYESIESTQSSLTLSY